MTTDTCERRVQRRDEERWVTVAEGPAWTKAQGMTTIWYYRLREPSGIFRLVKVVKRKVSVKELRAEIAELKQAWSTCGKGNVRIMHELVQAREEAKRAAEKEREAVVDWLRSDRFDTIATLIDRGEHHKSKTPPTP